MALSPCLSFNKSTLPNHGLLHQASPRLRHSIAPPRCELSTPTSTSTSTSISTSSPSFPCPKSPSSSSSYYIMTMGCQMNVADSERMAGALAAQGYAEATSPDLASLLILNTCSIRDKAEQKVYSALGRQRARKYIDPDFRIVVAGCVAQQEGNALLRRVPEVDLVMGPQHVGRLTELLEEVELGSQVCATEAMHINEDITKPRRESKVTAWVNIIYGCNEGCTYCVVPGVRGAEQSRDPEAIKNEMIALGEAGYKEVTLLGQNIDAYGRDLGGRATDGSMRWRWTLADLLLHVHDVPGIERIRFATSHPRYFSERLIKTCAELPKVCKYFHIPFQSGDDDVLRQMRRGYTAERYLSIIEKIRHYMPNAAITADAIVGFPGETEEQFCNTLKLMEEVKFDVVNTAAYSPRPRTPAATWDNQVADLVKEDRLQRINRLVREHSLERNEKFLGQTEEVLVESRNTKAGREDEVWGRTESNKLVFFKGSEDLAGKLVNIRVVGATSSSLRGEREE